MTSWQTFSTISSAKPHPPLGHSADGVFPPSRDGVAASTRSCQTVTWLSPHDMFGKQRQLKRHPVALRFRNSPRDPVRGIASLKLGSDDCDRVRCWLIG